MSADRMKHSDNHREGYGLTVGGLWEIDLDNHSMRDLYVYASTEGIRILNMWCGELEDAERLAVRLTVDQALALAEILSTAAEAVKWKGTLWAENARRADPTAWLQQQSDERRAEFDRERAAGEHSGICPDCIADADAIGNPQ
jgi:hypothetical protein